MDEKGFLVELSGKHRSRTFAFKRYLDLFKVSSMKFDNNANLSCHKRLYLTTRASVVASFQSPRRKIFCNWSALFFII